MGGPHPTRIKKHVSDSGSPASPAFQPPDAGALDTGTRREPLCPWGQEPHQALFLDEGPANKVGNGGLNPALGTAENPQALSTPLLPPSEGPRMGAGGTGEDSEGLSGVYEWVSGTQDLCGPKEPSHSLPPA